MMMTRPIALVVCVTIQLGLLGCSPNQQNSSGGEMDALASSIQGKTPDEVYQAIEDEYGPPTRDVGSGLSIPQWDVEGGVLTYHQLVGPTFRKDDHTTWLIETQNPATECIYGIYEMSTLPDEDNHGSRFWIGTLTLDQDGQYQFEDSGQNQSHRQGQDDNYFMQHPSGTYTIEYNSPIEAQTALETLTSTTAIATITVHSPADSATAQFIIAANPQSRMIEFSSQQGLSFVMNKGWVHYW